MSAPAIVIEKAIDKRKFGRVKEGKVISIEMTKSCARDLTDRIKTAVDDLADMLYRAHEGRAWAALGYESWKAYCKTEFQMSKQHSYRLLDFVEIRHAIGHQLVTPQTESQVRALVPLEPEQQPVAWARAVEIAGGEQPTAKQVVRAVAKIIEPPHIEVIAPEEEAEKDGEALWKLKSAWKESGDKDRRRFLTWIIQEAKAKNER